MKHYVGSQMLQDANYGAAVFEQQADNLCDRLQILLITAVQGNARKALRKVSGCCQSASCVLEQFGLGGCWIYQ